MDWERLNKATFKHGEHAVEVEINVEFNTIDGLLTDPNNSWLMNIHTKEDIIVDGHEIYKADLFTNGVTFVNDGEYNAVWYTDEQDKGVGTMNGNKLIIEIEE